MVRKSAGLLPIYRVRTSASVCRPLIFLFTQVTVSCAERVPPFRIDVEEDGAWRAVQRQPMPTAEEVVRRTRRLAIPFSILDEEGPIPTARRSLWDVGDVDDEEVPARGRERRDARIRERARKHGDVRRDDPRDRVRDESSSRARESRLSASRGGSDERKSVSFLRRERRRRLDWATA